MNRFHIHYTKIKMLKRNTNMKKVERKRFITDDN